MFHGFQHFYHLKRVSDVSMPEGAGIEQKNACGRWA
jgi:hypothetical protein